MNLVDIRKSVMILSDKPGDVIFPEGARLICDDGHTSLHELGNGTMVVLYTAGSLPQPYAQAVVDLLLAVVPEAGTRPMPKVTHQAPGSVQ